MPATGDDQLPVSFDGIQRNIRIEQPHRLLHEGTQDRFRLALNTKALSRIEQRLSLGTRGLLAG